VREDLNEKGMSETAKSVRSSNSDLEKQGESSVKSLDKEV
jgi:hypothetical protein